MEGYFLPRDSYRRSKAPVVMPPLSVGYHEPYHAYGYVPLDVSSSGLDRWSSYNTVDAVSLYYRPRIPSDLPASYFPRVGIPGTYQTGAVLPLPSSHPHSLGIIHPKRNPLLTQKLKAVKKPFKRAAQKQSKVFKVVQNTRQKGARRKPGKRSFEAGKELPSEGKKFLQAGKKGSKRFEFVKTKPFDLAEEVRALHNLWRTGPGGSHSSVAVEKIKPRPPKGSRTIYQTTHVTAVKRKPEPQIDHSKVVKKEGLTKSRRRRNKKLAKKKRLTEEREGAGMSSAVSALKSSSEVKLLGFSLSTEDVFKARKSKNSEAALVIKEEQVDFEVSVDLQRVACKRVIEFLNSLVDGDAEMKKLTPQEEKDREEEGFLFFSKLFEENQDLRSLYIDQRHGGTFDCLICHSMGESKSFDKLLNLVMHATSRVNRRPEHRGYGRAVHTILGWNSSKPSK